jgi:NADPH2:quinone reductase
MHAVRIHEQGGVDVLRYEETEQPTPGAGEVVVKVAASGVNFIDIYQRSGVYSIPLPYTLGMEAAGTIASIGEGVTGFAEGDPVAFAMAPGSYAEYVKVAAAKAVPVPAGVDLKLAAAVMLQGMTAHYLAYSTFALKKGDVALVHAAAGGVGLLLTQIAKKIGATVIGTVSTEEKAELARAAGADEVILYTKESFVDGVKRFTGGERIDVVYDSVGQSTFEGGLDLLRPRGTFVLFGQSSGVVPPFDLNVLNGKGSLFVTRPTLGHYILTRDELLWRSGDLFNWMAAGELDVRVDQALPLSQAAQAHELLNSRATSGKLILIP